MTQQNVIYKFNTGDEIYFAPNYLPANLPGNNYSAEQPYTERYIISGFFGKNTITTEELKDYDENDIIFASSNGSGVDCVFKIFSQSGKNVDQRQRYDDILSGRINIHGSFHVLNIGLLRFGNQCNDYKKKTFNTICMALLSDHRRQSSILAAGLQQQLSHNLILKTPLQKKMIDNTYNYNGFMACGLINNDPNLNDEDKIYLIHGDAKHLNIMFNGQNETPCIIDYEYSFTVDYNLANIVPPWNVLRFTQNDFTTFPVFLLAYSQPDTSHFINNPIFFAAVKDILNINMTYVLIAIANKICFRANTNKKTYSIADVFKLYEAYGCYIMGYKKAGTALLKGIFCNISEVKIIDNFINTTLYYIKKNMIEKKHINYDNLMETYDDIKKCYECFSLLNYNYKDSAVDYIPSEDPEILSFIMTMYGKLLRLLQKECKEINESKVTTYMLVISAFLMQCKVYRIYNKEDFIVFINNEDNINAITKNIASYLNNLESDKDYRKYILNIVCNIYSAIMKIN